MYSKPLFGGRACGSKQTLIICKLFGAEKRLVVVYTLNKTITHKGLLVVVKFRMSWSPDQMLQQEDTSSATPPGDKAPPKHPLWLNMVTKSLSGRDLGRD